MKPIKPYAQAFGRILREAKERILYDAHAARIQGVLDLMHSIEQKNILNNTKFLLEGNICQDC